MTEDPFQSPAAPLDAGPERDARPGIPWENEQSFPALVETFKAIARDSDRLFQSAGQDLPIGSALTYALIIGVVGGAGAAIWGSLMSTLTSLAGDPAGWLGSLAGAGLGSVVSIPLGVIVSTFISSGVVHAGLAIFNVPHRSFDTTVRAIAFASGTAAILQVIPVIGALIGWAVGLVLEVRAIRGMHGTTTSSAALVVLVPMLFCCVVVFGGSVLVYQLIVAGH